MLNRFYGIIPIIIFLLALNSLHGVKKQSSKSIQPACFSAPLWMYSEEKRAYYRQDWCKTGKTPIYWENIPVFEKEAKTEKFLSLR